jgi:hypothetical protein
VGCTTITGDDQPVSYVAAGDDKGGAARCQERGLATRVRALRRRSDVDDVALVQGAGPQARPSLLYDWLLVIGRGVGTVRHDVLPGARAWSPLGPIRSTR